MTRRQQLALVLLLFRHGFLLPGRPASSLTGFTACSPGRRAASTRCRRRAFLARRQTLAVQPARSCWRCRIPTTRRPTRPSACMISVCIAVIVRILGTGASAVVVCALPGPDPDSISPRIWQPRAVLLGRGGVFVPVAGAMSAAGDSVLDGGGGMRRAVCVQCGAVGIAADGGLRAADRGGRPGIMAGVYLPEPAPVPSKICRTGVCSYSGMLVAIAGVATRLSA